MRQKARRPQLITQRFLWPDCRVYMTWKYVLIGNLEKMSERSTTKFRLNQTSIDNCSPTIPHAGTVKKNKPKKQKRLKKLASTLSDLC